MWLSSYLLCRPNFLPRKLRWNWQFGRQWTKQFEDVMTRIDLMHTEQDFYDLTFPSMSSNLLGGSRLTTTHARQWNSNDRAMGTVLWVPVVQIVGYFHCWTRKPKHCIEGCLNHHYSHVLVNWIWRDSWGVKEGTTAHTKATDQNSEGERKSREKRWVTGLQPSPRKNTHRIDLWWWRSESNGNRLLHVKVHSLTQRESEGKKYRMFEWGDRTRVDGRRKHWVSSFLFCHLNHGTHS